jgi:hypothetical protein
MAFWLAHASRCYPARAHGVCAQREHRGGDLATGYMMVKTQSFLRVNGLQALAYTPLHLDLHEVARKGVLTDEVVRAAATDGVDD